ncbi:predicted protein, partial [Naegleria gruberi]
NRNQFTEEVVVKKVYDTPETEDFHESNKLLQKLDHSNIIKYLDHGKFDSPETGEFLYIVTEKGDEDLARYLKERQTNHANDNLQEMLEIFVQLVRGVAFIHSQNIYHRDIKPANVVVRKNDWKIIDFEDYAKTDTQDESISAQKVGTEYYMAPQICIRGCKDRILGNSLDSYSLGCTLLEMITDSSSLTLNGNTLAYNLVKNEESDVHNHIRKVIGEKVAMSKQSCGDLVCNLIQKSAAKRLTARCVLVSVDKILQEISVMKNPTRSRRGKCMVQ